MAQKFYGNLTARSVNRKVLLSWYLTNEDFLSDLRGETQNGQKPLRILRMKHPEFHWGEDYAEFFSGLNPAEGEEIHRGPLPVINQRKFEFEDSDVEPRTSYSYWVAPEDGEPVGPAPVRVTDPDVWWTFDRIQSTMDELERDCGAKVETYGSTCFGRSLRAARLGAKDRCIALVGLIHAGESGPELVLPAARKLAEENADLLQRVGIAVLPVVNADERERLAFGCSWYLRVNSAGVDLNRNFPAGWEEVHYGYGLISSDPDAGTYRGPAPLSEPEARAVEAFMKANRPEAMFAYHWLASITGAGLLGPTMAEGDEAYLNSCKRMSTAYGRGFHDDPEREHGFGLGTTGGSLPTWCYREFNIPAFDLESSGSFEGENAARKGLTTAEMVREYSERHYNAIRAVLEELAA